MILHVYFLMFVSLSSSQKAHVQQFVATEDALNKAAEARSISEKLLVRLHGSDVNSHLPNVGGTSHNVGSLRQFQVVILVKHLMQHFPRLS